MPRIAWCAAAIIVAGVAIIAAACGGSGPAPLSPVNTSPSAADEQSADQQVQPGDAPSVTVQQEPQLSTADKRSDDAQQQRNIAAEPSADRQEQRDDLRAAVTGSFSAISAGDEHTCERHESGVIECWGSNEYGQSSPPAGSFSAVSAGYWHTCAIRTDGAIECWGTNDDGQSSPPVGSFSAMNGGGWHTCAIRDDGVIECWGGNYHGQADPPAGNFNAVSAGFDHSCAIRDTGVIECWGSNDYGQSIPPAGSFSAVSAGYYHTCAIRTDGAIECWGSNTRDERNEETGEWEEIYAGQADPPTGSFSAVSAGFDHSCAIRDDGAIECWGSNGYGQSSPPAGRFSAVSVGGAHACGLTTSGAIECWGANESGQLDAPTPTVAQPSADRQEQRDDEAQQLTILELANWCDKLYYEGDGERMREVDGTEMWGELLDYLKRAAELGDLDLPDALTDWQRVSVSAIESLIEIAEDYDRDTLVVTATPEDLLTMVLLSGAGDTADNSLRSRISAADYQLLADTNCVD